MAFNGSWYIKVGTYAIPLSIMKYGSYKSAPAQRQDMDSYVDANGYLHRNPLEHTRSKLEFTTIILSELEFRQFMDNITAQYTNGLEKKVHLTYYEEEYGNYVEGDFYMPATQEYPYLNKEWHDETRIAFIEY
jgi:hypothetical protein